MTISRRALLQSAAFGTAAAAGIGFKVEPGWAQSDSVNVASLHDLSGAVDVYGVPSHMCMKFAIDEINASGGLLGKKLDLKVYDGQSDIKKFPQYAQQAALNDKVVMLQGAITGASREATRPVLRRYKVPFVYGTIYEGGLCEKNAISVNTGSDQQAVPLLEWSFKNLGKKVFYIGADYNAPRNIGIWTNEIAKRQGRRSRRRGILSARRHGFQHGDQQDPGGQARLRAFLPGRRPAHVLLPAVGRGRHAARRSRSSPSCSAAARST